MLRRGSRGAARDKHHFPSQRWELLLEVVIEFCRDLTGLKSRSGSGLRGVEIWGFRGSGFGDFVGV